MNRHIDRSRILLAYARMLTTQSRPESSVAWNNRGTYGANGLSFLLTPVPCLTSAHEGIRRIAVMTVAEKSYCGSLQGKHVLASH